MNSQRALLDQLMGRDRNIPLEEKAKRKVRFDDREVCQWFNLEFCPHDLFGNTKSDLGPCPKTHDVKLKDEYHKAASEDARLKRDFESSYLRYLESIIADVDSRIQQAHARIDEEAGPVRSQEAEEKKEQAKKIEDQIHALTQQMKELGEQGKVDEAQALLKLTEELKTKRATLLAEAVVPDAKMVGIIQQKKMRVCDICGAFLVENDAEQRVISHLEGKQHVGWNKVRETIAKLKESLGSMAASGVPVGPGRPNGPPPFAGPRRRSRTPPYRGRPGGGGSGSRRRSRSRSHSRGRDRDRDRDRDRYRDRDRDRGSRSDHRRRRSRSRSKSRSRSRDRDRRRH